MTIEKIWQELAVGDSQRKHPYHVPAIATVSPTQSARVRTVVLRASSQEGRFVQFHTDMRSPKVTEIRDNSSVAALFYNPETKFQLRISGVAVVHHEDSIADSAWEKTRLLSRRCYLSTPPGEPLNKQNFGLPEKLTGRQPTEKESAAARVNFGVVRITVEEIDALELHYSGHKRHLFSWDERLQQFKSIELVP